MTFLWRIADTLLAMSGVVLEHMTPLRWLAIAASYAGYWLLARHGTPEAVLAYYAVATAAHYYYLFAMFRPGGWAAGQRARLGDERGFLRHEGWMAFLFCHNALSIGLACSATGTSPFEGGLSTTGWLRLGGAAALVALGLGAKLWATLLVGRDAYYYRDLFLGLPPGGLVARGPYRWFRDPMYTVGHLQAYGLALYYGSGWGLLAVAANQGLVLLFNALVEQPHVTNAAGSPAG